jgi:hypothetical protein
MIAKKGSGKFSVQQAIKEAEKTLSSVEASEDEYHDPRWQAIIAVGEYIETNPHEVWCFIRKWGTHPSSDLRAAIATCLLEHLLEYHFDKYFPLVKQTCTRNRRFADTFQNCFPFGQAMEPKNLKSFKSLKNKLD